MSERSTHHATFVIERSYPASPARVFKAWADPVAKARWFAPPPAWKMEGHRIDFRVGGREQLRAVAADGIAHRFDGLYQDIVPDRRIVYSYDMHLDDTRISVSLATVELKPAGIGTRLIFTEQGVFLDGHDNVDQREAGSQALLDKLAAELARPVT